jgi:hypothetical protein
MARSVQRRELMLAGTKSEHDDEYRVSRPEHSEDRCGYTLLSVVPIVSMRVEGGYAARFLLCGSAGPVRDNGESARRGLLNRGVRDEE